MAKVEVKRTKIEEVVLRLTESEAKVLLSLLGSVMGDPKTTIRKYTDSVFEAIRTSCPEFSDWEIPDPFESKEDSDDFESFYCVSLNDFFSSKKSN
jgi:hypothetical protein